MGVGAGAGFKGLHFKIDPEHPKDEIIRLHLNCIEKKQSTTDSFSMVLLSRCVADLL